MSERAQEVARRLGDALTRLGRLRQRPEEFVPSDNIPWEAQAQQLLRCQLEGGFMGLRPPARVAREVATLDEQLALPPQAEVMVLGCGPGMYSHRLAERGYRVTGIDIARPVIEYASEQAQTAGVSCEYVCGSFLEMEYEDRFDAVVWTNSIINQLSPIQLDQVLGRVYRALRCGGQFACELHVRAGRAANVPAGETRRVYDLPYSPWSAEPHLWLERQLFFPGRAQQVVHHIVVCGDSEPREYWSRYDLFDRAWFDRRLTKAGFAARQWLADDLLRDFDARGDVAWVLAVVP